MDTEQELDSKIDKILPQQSPKDNKGFFLRNGKQIIIIVTILTVLYILANVYARVAINNLYHIINVPQ